MLAIKTVFFGLSLPVGSFYWFAVYVKLFASIELRLDLQFIFPFPYPLFSGRLSGSLRVLDLIEFKAL